MTIHSAKTVVQCSTCINTRKMHILIYHHDAPELTLKCVQTAYEHDCIPIVLSDGNTTQIKRTLKAYSGKIDIIQFDAPIGFDMAIVSGFHHIFRGSYPKHIATIDATIDNPFYIGELHLQKNQSPQDIFAIERIHNQNGWIAKSIERIIQTLNKYLRNTIIQDPLTSYAVFPATYIRELLDALDDKKHAVILQLLIQSSKYQRNVQSLPIDATKSESWTSYLYALYISLP
jgi:hypothetical protein